MDTVNAFFGIILKFGQEVGMKDAFAHSIEITFAATLAIALLSCFFGAKIVRLCSAVMAFFLAAIAICEILRPTANMGVIVITFAIVGLICAFLVFQWYKFSMFLFSAMIGYSIALFLTSDMWICFGAAIVLGIMSLVFLPVVVILSTAVWGGVTLGFGGLPYIGIDLLAFKILAAAVLSAAGIFLQYSMGRNLLISKKRTSHGKHARH